MVYTGKPSRGCATCRRRKIKCDLASPGCSYCLKTKKQPCPGYPSEFDAVWRDQSSATKAKVNLSRRRGALRASSVVVDSPAGASPSNFAVSHFSETAGVIPYEAESSVIPATERSLPNQPSRRERSVNTTFSSNLRRSPCISPTIKAHYEDRVTDFFFSTYIFLQPDSAYSRGFLDVLYPVFINAPASSPIIPAVLSVASCLFEAWTLLKPYLPALRCQEYYTTALQRMRQEIPKQKSQISDEVLASSLILDMFENLSAFFKFRSRTSTHIDGSAGLLASRLKNPSAADDPVSKVLVAGARRQIINTSVARKTAVPLDIMIFDESPQGILRTPNHDLDELKIEVANLQSLAQDPVFAEEAKGELVRQAAEIDLQLVSWYENLPEDWRPIRVFTLDSISARVRQAGVYAGYCDIHRTVQVASTLNQFSILRVRTLTIMLESQLSVGRSETRETIQKLADDVCATVPYFLGSRVRPNRINETDIDYPRLSSHRALPEGYMGMAASYGGWFPIANLSELLGLGVGQHLRQGQVDWIVGQIRRIVNVYCIVPPKQQPDANNTKVLQDSKAQGTSVR